MADPVLTALASLAWQLNPLAAWLVHSRVLAALLLATGHRLEQCGARLAAAGGAVCTGRRPRRRSRSPAGARARFQRKRTRATAPGSHYVAGRSQNPGAWHDDPGRIRRHGGVHPDYALTKPRVIQLDTVFRRPDRHGAGGTRCACSWREVGVAAIACLGIWLVAGLRPLSIASSKRASAPRRSARPGDLPPRASW